MTEGHFELEKAARPNILSLKPYRCARDDYSEGILLDANENTHGPSLAPTSLEGYENAQLERYPDPHQIELKKLLCSLRGPSYLDPSHFFIGVGSDECIDMVMRVFVEPGKEKILITPPTYGMYSVSAQINNVGVVKVPLLLDSFQLNVPEIVNAVQEDPLIKVIILCSPGNPTGTKLAISDIKELLSCQSFKGVVVVDEAYIDFCEDGSSAVPLVSLFPQLIVSQTLSKAFGLAGIRCGFTISHPSIARLFNNTKAPYNISTPTSTLASCALSQNGLEVNIRNITSIKEERDRLKAEIVKLNYVSSILGANDANFILARIVDTKSGDPDNQKAHHIYKTLAESEKVVVRYRGNEMGCEGCLRITIGTHAENQVLLDKLKAFQ